MSNNMPSNTLVALSPQQREAVIYPESLLVLSGPGTGKTRIIIERIKWLLRRGVPSSSIMAVTFTRKAAEEMRTGIAADARDMWLGTFNSLGYRFLREHQKWLDMPENFQVTNFGRQKVIIGRILEDMGFATDKKPNKELTPNKVRNYIERRKNRGKQPMFDPHRQGSCYDLYSQFIVKLTSEEHVDSELLNMNHHQLCHLEKTFYHYEKTLSDEYRVDIADLMLLPHLLLTQHEDLRNKWRSRFEHILVDELQDIDYPQFNFLSSLRTGNMNYFGAGDDNQSIYGFRGAAPKLLNDFKDQFTNSHSIVLDQNHRSSDEILLLANAIAKHREVQGNFTLSGVRGSCVKPKLTEYIKPQQEAAHVVAQIKELHQNHVPLNNIAILYRNNLMAEHVEKALTSNKLPYRLRSDKLYYDSPGVKYAVSYLTIANHPLDIDAIFLSAKYPLKRTLNTLKERVTDWCSSRTNPIRELRNSFDADERKFAELIYEIRSSMIEEGLVAAVKTAVHTSGLMDYYKRKSREGEVDNLNLFIKDAEDYAEHSVKPNVVDYLNLAKIDSEVSDEKDLITLATIHRSKGLEFDHVFIIGLWDKVFPRHVNSAKEVADDRKLLYVGVTRARRTLRLSYTATRYRRNGTPEDGELSMLLKDLNDLDELCERGKLWEW